MTHGLYLSVAAVVVIMAIVALLAFLSALICDVGGLQERRARAVFSVCLLAIWVGTFLVAAMIRPGVW
jgi:hypothetical protein